MDYDLIEQFFFKSMQNGYAFGHQGQIVSTYPNHKELQFVDGDFWSVDRWLGTDYGGGAGTTTIFYQRKPVWIMQYLGWYDESAISFLMEALRATYRVAAFIGGRGPENYSSPWPFIYANRWHGQFALFEGREEIFSTQGGSMGYHQYMGRIIG